MNSTKPRSVQLRINALILLAAAAVLLILGDRFGLLFAGGATLVFALSLHHRSKERQEIAGGDTSVPEADA